MTPAAGATSSRFESRPNSSRGRPPGKQAAGLQTGPKLDKGSDQSELNRHPWVSGRLGLTFWIEKVDRLGPVGSTEPWPDPDFVK